MYIIDFLSKNYDKRAMKFKIHRYVKQYRIKLFNFKQNELCHVDNALILYLTIRFQTKLTLSVDADDLALLSLQLFDNIICHMRTNEG